MFTKACKFFAKKLKALGKSLNDTCLHVGKNIHSIPKGEIRVTKLVMKSLYSVV